MRCQLTEAEASFRALKSELSIRPLFHQLERRVRITEPSDEQKNLLQQLGLALADCSQIQPKCSVDFAIA